LQRLSSSVIMCPVYVFTSLLLDYGVGWSVNLLLFCCSQLREWFHMLYKAIEEAKYKER
jgi:hypothetical protein